ncbi:thiamine-phosphate kinase [Candidatus Latescibacterota bacterium]
MTPKRQTLADTGELEFIRRIRDMMPQDGGVIVRSVGDDCLATEALHDGRALYTIDTFVDSVHFTPEYSSYGDIGARCMAASVSDIAAMSGIPSYTLVSLSMPESLAIDDAVELFKGLSSTAGRYCCPLSGGETTSTPGPLTVTITVIGTVEQDRMALRSGAREGDSIYVSGSVGDAMGGLRALQDGRDGHDSLKRKFLTPEARVELSRSLSELYSVGAMIDLSDGIATDLRHICDESGTGAMIDAGLIPLSSELQSLMAETDEDPVAFALTAGEDFEILFTSDDDSLSGSQSICDLPITRIGTITGESGGIIVRRDNGTSKTLAKQGYEHFTS